MKLVPDPLRKKIGEALHGASLHLGAVDLTVDQLAEAFVEPPNPDLGDLAFPCFPLAKSLRKNPAQVAKDLAVAFPGTQIGVTAEAVGPYLNLRVSPKSFGEEIGAAMLAGDVLQGPLSEGAPKSMIEFCQPNTHKELHVGHMRNACLGDSLVRVLRAAGYPVISSTFPGDVGTHVAKCLWYLKKHVKEPVPAEGKGEWLGRLYSKGHLLLEDEIGTPKEDENRKELTEILKQLESRNGEYYELWKETRQWSIELMNRVYQWADIQFDKWYWESEMDSPSVSYVNKLFAEGKLVRSEGAVGMDLSDVKLGFCLLLKSDGTGLYATKDLELARCKFQDFHIEKSIYVVDMRQALHFQQVFKVLERLGFEQAKNCVHLQYNYVELPDGAMSSRKGNIIPLTTLVHRMEDMVKSQYLSKYRGDWTDQEIELVAQQVAQGAIKYGMIKIDTGKKIVFDMEEWLKIDGDSGPFIQYSAARIQSLVNKLGPLGPEVRWDLLVHPSERALIQSMLFFRSTVQAAAQQMKPSFLCTYLFGLAQRFNHFYHECSIGQAETPELKNARLALSQACGLVLKQGLALLGIPTPKRM